MLNRRIAALALIGSLSLATTAQAWSWGKSERVKGSGEVVSEVRDLGAFDGISLAGSFKVLVRQGSGTKLELKADKNLLPLIETRVVEGSKGRTLEITPKKGFSLSSKTEPQITLEVAQLRMIAIAGSGDVRVEAMKTPSVDVSIGGSGEVDLVDLSSDRLGVQVSGSGDVKASGRTGSLSLSVGGSGDVHARELQADEVRASIAGSGNATVYAVKTLKISIAGSGDIAYRGSPQVSSSVAGHGNISKLN
ncbi:head GIN domain-containing protein [Paucibacter sp. AS339]|uniref:head GIN domain-containing protein n=1 Tax=Paucibacter hankyongi TaxID=3133434 RepID=UPI0030987228